MTVPIPNPSPSGLYWIMPDEEPRNNPATHKSLVDLYFKITPKMSAYIHAIERLLNPNMSTDDLEKNLNALFGNQTAFTNGHAYDTDDWKIENLDCGGATVQAVGSDLFAEGRKALAPDQGNRSNLPA